jgi:molecular chaperone Hsp33
MQDVAACGFLVQALPGASDEDLAAVEANVAGLPGLATMLEDPLDPDVLIDRLMIGLDTRARHEMTPRFECPCSAERAARTLSLLDRHELEEMIGAGASQEVVCDFCGLAYQVDSAEMQRVLAAVDAAG